ncbi:short-chain dehydrogenase [Bacillus sp. AFS015802]|uniref:SDR family oxidoreductase n=1 Tax=Bacillus sp. AFS015802 TaxID=2033486 RepID=UPI000BF4F594|nr:SDR family oxidoreductase [Bacillus sp. AFS015802]PFA67034.1 short-chain dehydrogenase [Bacillus sp. AFS015802]
MNQKIAVVTGSNSGFGLLSSLELAQIGFTVIATMRDVHKDEDLISQAKIFGVEKSIHIHSLDVTSEESIKEFSSMIAKIGRVDLLLNNAGYAGGGFAEEVSIEEFRAQFETNVFGAMRVTQLVLPYMRKQGKGKIINMGSISGRIGFPGLSPYVSSKHALEGYSESLRLELKPFGIDVHLIEPGSYRTNIWTSGKKVANRSLEKHSPYYFYMKAINAEIESGEDSLGDPREVASIVGELAQYKRNTFRIPIGKGIRLMLLLKNLLPWNILEKAILKKLRIKNGT